ncbi:MAG: pantothenate kinase [Thermoproteota archaeon]|nr:MAG: pantothenate kinase [Candidatus Korarchaeota archaeon]
MGGSLKLMVGVDLGGTRTKAVALEQGRLVSCVCLPTTDPISSLAGALGKLLYATKASLSDVAGLAVTGGGVRQAEEVFGIKPTRVDEIRSIGLGGVFLSGKKRALVASIGTGTALVRVEDSGARVEHVGGTGVGGGTIRGLGYYMLRRQSFESLRRLASRGSPLKVNVTVGDIAGGPVGIIPPEETASNFGKISEDALEEDVAAGIFRMVGEVVGTVAYFAAKAYGLERDIVVVGSPAAEPPLKSAILHTIRLFGGEATVPEHAEYAPAIGAAKHIAEATS